MKGLKINILLCDTFPGLLPEFIPSYDYLLRKLFLDAIQKHPVFKEYIVTFQTFNTYLGELPKEIRPDELYLIPGSNSGVYEDKKWIRKLLGFIQRAHRKKTPMVGICFGHQAIAQALGGKVEPSERGWGTGIRTSLLLAGAGTDYLPDGTLSLHYNHHDQVLELPPEAIRLATSGFCVNEGFRIGDHILAFQGHPEYTDKYNRHLLLNHATGEPEEVKAAALESIKKKKAQGKKVALWILSLVR
ncbi:MAG: type 1 glutamine amidotransferase [Tannerellaceae bacterium]|nr:type 1 glutamine amidotransferase [Tannerellaceae bacterium]